MRYRAFLSYSHADNAFAEAFHKDLERWRADRGLVGRRTERGDVPKDLRPIFRDRDDFAGGRTLQNATREALENSEFLVLLCSPAAAKSPYVNDEVRAFKALGRAGRIIPVIIAGEPGHPEENCFPQALLRGVDARGRLTDDVEEPLAADAREQGDGRRRALAKVIAGLIGLPFDEIVKRAERAQRRRMQAFAAIAASMTILAAAAGTFGWLAETRRIAAERNYAAALSAADGMLGQIGEELIRTEGVSLETTKRILGRSEAIYDELMVSLPDAIEVRAGKIAALTIYARAYFAKGDARAADEALAEAERLTGVMFSEMQAPMEQAPPIAILRAERARLLAERGDAAGAAELYGLASDVLMQSDVRAGWSESDALTAADVTMRYGALLHSAGRPDAAAEALAKSTEVARAWAPKSAAPDDWLILESMARFQHAHIDWERGDLAAAREQFLRSIDTAQLAVDRAPDNAARKLVLVAALRDASNLGKAMGLDAAAAQEKARADRLLASMAAADLENAIAQLLNNGAAAAAASAQIDAGETGAAQDLAAALAAIERAWRADGGPLEIDTARKAFLTAAEAYNRNGYVDEALAAARVLIEIEATATDPDAPFRLMDAHFQARLAEELRENHAAALVHAEAALDIQRTLTAGDPSRRHFLALAEWGVGQLLWKLSRRTEAEARYEQVVALFSALARETPDDTEIGSNLSWTCVNLGELKALNGQAAAARSVFRDCLDNARRVHRLAPDAPSLRLDLAWAEARMALIDGDVDGWRRTEALLSELDAAAPLDDLEDELLTVARIAIAGR